jgi:hypothetical protein
MPVKATFINVQDYGAVGNGTTDDTTAIQNAINAAESNLIRLEFPMGTYIISGSLTIPSGIEINGNGATIKRKENITINLTSSVISTDTTFNVTSTSSFPSSGIFKVDSEVIQYTGKTSTTLSGLTRGYYSSTAASHALNAVVRLMPQIFDMLKNDDPTNGNINDLPKSH